MKNITDKTILKQNGKLYNSVDINDVIYWFDTTLPIDEEYPKIVLEKVINGNYVLMQIDNINDIDRSRQYQIIAQSSPNLEEIPVISFDMYLQTISQQEYPIKKWNHIPSYYDLYADDRRVFIKGYKANPNKYTENDILKAIEFAYGMGYQDRDLDIGHGSNLPFCKEYIMSLSIIEVDETFNIISYE